MSNKVQSSNVKKTVISPFKHLAFIWYLDFDI